ncbi:hypothetical protein B0H13DRAFT_2452565 [Mycena leptocephala]|nr:hypothetical protein B0H13DRAFT_2452565 [Mycena leptocephala]
MTSPGVFWRKKLRRISRTADKTASEGEGKVLKCAIRVVRGVTPAEHSLNVVFWTCCEKAWTKHEGEKRKVGTNTSPPQGSRSTLPIILLARVRLRIPARGQSCSALRESAQYNTFVYRGQRGVWSLSCTESSSVRALAPGGWMASRRDARRETGAAAAATGGCAVRASTVAEVEGSQCVRRRGRRRRQGGTLAEGVADTVGAARDWSEDAHGARGRDGGASAEHQGAPTQLLHMHLVLRVVRSGYTAGMSFERQGRIAQDTVAVGGRGQRRLERRESLARHVVSAGGGSGRDFNVRVRCGAYGSGTPSRMGRCSRPIGSVPCGISRAGSRTVDHRGLGAEMRYANVLLLELGQVRARAEGKQEVSIWTEGKKARKVGRNEWGKDGEDKAKGAREREGNGPKRRLRGYPKSIAERASRGRERVCGEAKFQQRVDAWTKLWSR